jgi:hypothetical protein
MLFVELRSPQVELGPQCATFVEKKNEAMRMMMNDHEEMQGQSASSFSAARGCPAHCGDLWCKKTQRSVKKTQKLASSFSLDRY